MYTNTPYGMSAYNHQSLGQSSSSQASSSSSNYSVYSESDLISAYSLGVGMKYDQYGAAASMYMSNNAVDGGIAYHSSASWTTVPSLPTPEELSRFEYNKTPSGKVLVTEGNQTVEFFSGVANVPSMTLEHGSYSHQ